jgi:parallel beta-helix repeat protein
MRSSVRVLIVAMAMVAVAIAFTATSALANHVQCGDVITQDTTLDSDLIDCPGDGIVIGADSVKLDLNGHTIDGVGTSGLHGARGVVGTSTADCPVGCSRGVTIEDGTIRQFFLGIELNSLSTLGDPPATIRHLTISDTGLAMEAFLANMRIQRNSMDSTMWVGASPETVIERNHVSNGGIGIADGSGARVERNSVTGGLFGIRVSDSADNLLIRNELSAAGVGIDASRSAYRTRVERNYVHDNVGDGIRVDCCESQVVDNVATRNGDDGIDVSFGSDEFGPNVVARNTADHNGDLGIVAAPGVIDGGGNRARNNGNVAQCLGVRCK